MSATIHEYSVQFLGTATNAVPNSPPMKPYNYKHLSTDNVKRTHEDSYPAWNLAPYLSQSQAEQASRGLVLPSVCRNANDEPILR